MISVAPARAVTRHGAKLVLRVRRAFASIPIANSRCTIPHQCREVAARPFWCVVDGEAAFFVEGIEAGAIDIRLTFNDQLASAGAQGVRRRSRWRLVCIYRIGLRCSAERGISWICRFCICTEQMRYGRGQHSRGRVSIRHLPVAHDTNNCHLSAIYAAAIRVRRRRIKPLELEGQIAVGLNEIVMDVHAHNSVWPSLPPRNRGLRAREMIDQTRKSKPEIEARLRQAQA